MAINKDYEAKLLEFIGVENIENEEQFNKFKEDFNAKFLTREQAASDEGLRKKIVGKRMGEITSVLNDFGKSIGLETSYEKLAEKPIEENIAMFKEAIGSKIETLQSKAKEGNDKRLNDLTKQYEEAQKSIHSYKEANEQLQSKLQEVEQNFTNELNSYKVNTQLKDIKSALPWVDGIKDVQRVGFDALLSSKYKFGLDGDKVTVTDTEGNLIPLKDKAGAFADPATVIKQLAEENGLLKKNNATHTEKKRIFAKTTDDGGEKPKVASTYEARIRQIQAGR